jgi:morphogenetic protein associated with SpoVID
LKIHMVKSGDSMYAIAQKYGVDLDQLIAFNPQISNPDQIDVGMKVKIPAAVVHDGHPGVEYAHKHVVAQGDSLWKISKAWGLSLKEMIDANPQLKNPSVLLTGEIVNIPKQASSSPITPMMNLSNDYANMSGLGNAGAVAPIMNTISPENVQQLANNIPQLVAEAPAQMPISPPVNLPEAPQLPPIISPVETQPPKKELPPIISPVETQPPKEELPPIISPVESQPTKEQPEPKNESIEIYSPSSNLFAQFNVPAIEVQGKQEQLESFQMPEFAMPQWPTSSPYLSEQPMTYTSPYTNEQPVTDPYHSFYAKADCGCGCGGNKNAAPYIQEQPAYQPLQKDSMSYPVEQSMQPMMPYYMQQPMEPMMPYYMQQPMQPMMPYYMEEPMQPMMPYYMEEPMHPMMPYFMQQPNLMDYPEWNPYAANAAFSPTNIMYPTAESPSSLYSYMSPCYPICPPAQMNYLHGMQAPNSPWTEPTAPSFQDVEKRVDEQGSKEQEQDLLKASAIEVSSQKIKVPRKSSTRNSQALDDRMILHNFLQQKSANSDSFRESKSNEPWINR